MDHEDDVDQTILESFRAGGEALGLMFAMRPPCCATHANTRIQAFVSGAVNEYTKLLIDAILPSIRHNN